MKTQSANFTLESELKWENPAPGITRQIMGYDGQLMLVKLCFESGAVGAIHDHYHSQSSYIASGKFEVNVNGEKRILTTGDGFYAQPNLPHGVTCIEAGVVIDTFSPMREEFIK